MTKCGRCPPSEAEEMDEWVCIQEGQRFGLHTMRCSKCGNEIPITPLEMRKR